MPPPDGGLLNAGGRMDDTFRIWNLSAEVLAGVPALLLATNQGATFSQDKDTTVYGSAKKNLGANRPARSRLVSSVAVPSRECTNSQRHAQ